MPESAARVVYEFSGFRLDPQQRLLLTAPEGRPVALTSKAFDTLLFLIEHRSELLDKQSLMKALWPDVVVEENNLNQIISTLRKTLGETPGEHRFIVTVPGHGYRFVAEVTARSPTSTAPVVESTTAATLPESTPGPAHGSIAVLPFVNLTGDPSREYLSDGLAEELIGTLGLVPELRVPARTSSFAYKGRNIDVRQIAQDLDVAVVLEGSIRSAGERIRATAQLIDGQSGYRLWTQFYDRRFTDLFDLQEDLANEIVRRLAEHLQVNLPATLHVPETTPDLQAYDLYLQARSLIGRFSTESLAKAKEFLRQATRRDPRFAHAFSALGAAHLITYTNGVGAHARELVDAEDAARHALSIDPAMSESRGVLAQVQAYHRCDWVGARREYEKALETGNIEPTLHIFFAVLLLNVGRIAEARLEIQRAGRLAPGLAQVSSAAAILHSVAGLDTEALYFAEKAVNLGSSREDPPLVIVYSHAAFRRGDMAIAAREMTSALPADIQTQGGGEALRSIYAALADADLRPQAIAAMEELRAAAIDSESNLLPALLINLATMLGELDLAYSIADETLARRSDKAGSGVWGGLWIPEMRPFLRDTRFQSIADTLRMTEYWRQYGPPDNCEMRDGRLICH